MKNIVLAFAIGVSTLFVSCDQKSDKPEAPEETAVVQSNVVANAEVDMKVNGMMCSMGCKGAIERSLKGSKGIANCSVDFENGTAKITYDNNLTSDKEILEAVRSVNNGAYAATIIVAEEEITEEPITENTEA